MRRFLPLAVLVIVLSGCSVSVNTGNDPQVVVIASETSVPLPTLDPTMVADSSYLFRGTLKVSGSGVHISPDGSCLVDGLRTGDDLTTAYNLTEPVYGLNAGSWRIESGSAQGAECWLPFIGLTSISTKSVLIDLGLPGVPVITIDHAQFSAGTPFDISIVVNIPTPTPTPEPQSHRLSGTLAISGPAVSIFDDGSCLVPAWQSNTNTVILDLVTATNDAGGQVFLRSPKTIADACVYQVDGVMTIRRTDVWVETGFPMAQRIRIAYSIVITGEPLELAGISQ